MIFSIQRYTEDYLSKRGIADNDLYAVRVANAYDAHRLRESKEGFEKRIRRIRTTLFANHPQIDRTQFERGLISHLDSKAERNNPCTPFQFPGGLGAAIAKFRAKRRTIGALLSEFKKTIESRAIDMFWESRRDLRMRKRVEKIGQAALAVFVRGVMGSTGISFREVASGIGFVDFMIVFSNVPHLIEVKVLTGKLEGSLQLAKYLENENRDKGWLVLFDVRSPAKKAAIPGVLEVDGRRIEIVTIDLNPTVPSRLVRNAS